jgi:hypothetical protein
MSFCIQPSSRQIVVVSVSGLWWPVGGWRLHPEVNYSIFIRFAASFIMDLRGQPRGREPDGASLAISVGIIGWAITCSNSSLDEDSSLSSEASRVSILRLPLISVEARCNALVGAVFFDGFCCGDDATLSLTSLSFRGVSLILTDYTSYEVSPPHTWVQLWQNMKLWPTCCVPGSHFAPLLSLRHQRSAPMSGQL